LKIGIEASVLERTRTGVARYLSNLLRHWVDDYSDSQYLLYFKDSIPRDNILKHTCLESKVIRSHGPFNRGIVWELYTVGKAAKRDDLDIFFSPHYILPLISLNAKKVVGLWDIYFYVHPAFTSFRTRMYNTLFSRRTALNADAILSCSKFDKAEIVKHLGIPQDKVKVTYLAPEEKFKPISDRTELDGFKRKHRFKKKYFLYLGLIINRRFQDVVVRAFQRLLKQYPEDDLGLVIVGANRSYPFIDIQSLINRFNPDEAVRYIEYFPENEMVKLYNAALASIYLSSYEGEGIPLKEALACGTPVITSPVLLEVIGEQERAGYLVKDPKDEDELIGAFKSALFDEETRNDLIRKGMDRVKRFTWKHCAEETMKIFQEIHSRQNRR
jgi:glycosyltransferase involved in cell wall biosynthesis